jgi:hypothetical protein
VADELADAFLGLVLEDQNLLVFRLAHDYPDHASAVERGQADQRFAQRSAREKHLIEGDFGTDFPVDSVAANRIAFAYLKLLTVRLDDRVHNFGRVPSARRAVKRFARPLSAAWHSSGVRGGGYARRRLECAALAFLERLTKGRGTRRRGLRNRGQDRRELTSH